MRPFNYPPPQPLESLDEIIAGATSATTEALKDTLKEDGSVQGTLVETPDKVETKPIETQPDEKLEELEEELDEYGLTKAQQTEARMFFASLKDPEKAAKVVDFLATNNGYTKAPETKKEAAVQAKDLVEKLKESLGPELEYLAIKMGPVIKAELESMVEESHKPLKAQLDEQQLTRYKQEADTVTDSLATEWFGSIDKMPDKLVTQMDKVLKDMTPRPGQSMKEFLRSAMFAAAADLEMPLSKQSKTSTPVDTRKVERNRNDAAGRLASDSRAIPKAGEKALAPSRQMTLDDAVRQAASKAAESMAKN